MKTKLFLSYASEDKQFTDDLNAHLEQDFEVWYAPLKLVVGHSLLEEIGKGLAESDFGVVVFSRAYFKKEWTRNELDGLVALENETRKVVLPVWLEVQKSDVVKFSPMMAGRIGSIASRGVDYVAEDIRKAVQQLTRAGQLNPLQKFTGKVERLAELVSDHSAREKLMRGGDDSGRMHRACEQFLESAGYLIAALKAKLPGLGIHWGRNEQNSIMTGHANVLERFHLILSCVHSRHPSMCLARIRIHEMLPDGNHETLQEHEFSPTIFGGALCWAHPHREPETPEALAEWAVEILMEVLDQDLDSRRYGH